MPDAAPDAAAEPARKQPSCKFCYHRKLKCDRTLPGCGNCARYNQTCDYPLITARPSTRGPYKRRKLDHADGDTEHSTFASVAVSPEHSLDSHDTPHSQRSPVDRNDIGFVYGSRLNADHLLALHPSSGHILEYWHIYNERVQPMTMVLHSPSFSRKLRRVKDHLETCDYAMHALLFSIYHTVLEISENAEVESCFGASKPALQDRFLEGFRIALSNANLTGTKDIPGLQALVIYLTPLRFRTHCDHIWILMGVAIRKAQLLDLPKVVYTQTLTPLEAQLRRRLWWLIVRLDARISSMIDLPHSTLEISKECPPPLNINEEDIDEDMTVTPAPRAGMTAMTPILIGTRLVKLDHFGIDVVLGSETPTSTVDDLVEQKLERLACYARALEDEILRHLDQSRPLDWMTLIITHLLLTRSRLTVFTTYASTLSDALVHRLRDLFFEESIQILERTQSLKRHRAIQKWAWFFRDIIQWQPMVFVLGELTRRHPSDAPVVHRAWRAIDETFQDPNVSAVAHSIHRSTQFSNLRDLVARARSGLATRKARVAAAADDARVAPSPLPAAANFADGGAGYATDFSLGSAFVGWPPDPRRFGMADRARPPEAVAPVGEAVSVVDAPVLGDADLNITKELDGVLESLTEADWASMAEAWNWN